MKSLSRLFIGAAALLPAVALAWGGQGHRMVAKLAAEQLSPRATAEVARLLAGEKDPTMGGVATWADDLRDTDNALYKRTSAWHYINMAENGCIYTPPQQCKDGNCIVTALTTQARLLADPAQPLEIRRDALKWVIHLTGDIYQPMHAGFAKDKGGNDFQLQFQGKGTNLHRVWDSEMFYQRHLRDEAYMDLIRPVMAALQPVNPLTSNAAAIAVDSCKIDLQPGVYPNTHVLESSYIDQWRPVAEQRIAMAAQELADILNRVL